MGVLDWFKSKQHDFKLKKFIKLEILTEANSYVISLPGRNAVVLAKIIVLNEKGISISVRERFSGLAKKLIPTIESFVSLEAARKALGIIEIDDEFYTEAYWSGFTPEYGDTSYSYFIKKLGVKLGTTSCGQSYLLQNGDYETFINVSQKPQKEAIEEAFRTIEAYSANTLNA